jgi:oligopeptide transport system ATP-binding protein
MAKGETFGLVGESGCGKSTLGRTIIRITEPTGGNIYFEGRNIVKLNKKEMRQQRRDMQMIFQDPYSSLNPRMTVSQIIGRPLDIHDLYRDRKKERKLEVLKLVNLSQEDMDKYPHEFSGGQRQRIALARALVTNPKFLILDEPTSSLDVSVQARILNLLTDLRKEFEGTFFFISHDLSAIRQMCDKICVMYLGKIVEMATREELLASPKHPYTKTLLSALLDPELNVERIPVTGEPPSLYNLPAGCRFCNRCPLTIEVCRKQEPSLLDVGHGHLAACHLLA